MKPSMSTEKAATAYPTDVEVVDEVQVSQVSQLTFALWDKHTGRRDTM